MKTKILILMLAFIGTMSFGYSQRYAYVDTQFILDNIPDYKDAQSKLDEFAIKWQEEIEAKYALIESKKRALQAEEILLPEEIKKEKDKYKDRDTVSLDDLSITDELRDVLESFNETAKDRLEFEWPSAKAKIIRKRVLQEYSKEQIELMDDAIRRRLIGLFDDEGLFAMLDLPQKKGGCGIDKRIARKLVIEINRLIVETEKLEDYLKNSKKQVNLNVRKEKKTNRGQSILKDIRYQILALYNGRVTEIGIKNLDRFIRFRLENKINKSKFVSLVSMNTKKGGAGFNKRVARKFAKDLEFLMLIKFGEEKLEQ